MGYDTNFEGKLRLPGNIGMDGKCDKCGSTIKSPLLAEIRECLNEYFPASASADHRDGGYLALTLDKDDEGHYLEWDGSEKTYALDGVINSFLQLVRKKFPDFTLTGELQAQGEEMDDRWILRMVDGKAVRIKLRYIEETVETETMPADGRAALNP